MSKLIDVGRLSGPHGIKGWIKVHSHTDPASNIFDYQPWYLKTRHGVKTVELLNWQRQGKGFIAQIKGIDDRTEAERLCPVAIAADKSLLPELDDGEYYWHQLQSCRVKTTHAETVADLGIVKRMLATGANDVLVVQGDEQSIDSKERLIPYVPGQYVVAIELEQQSITVDWDPDF